LQNEKNTVHKNSTISHCEWIEKIQHNIYLD
jgi:hypothetical protein